MDMYDRGYSVHKLAVDILLLPPHLSLPPSLPLSLPSPSLTPPPHPSPPHIQVWLPVLGLARADGGGSAGLPVAPPRRWNECTGAVGQRDRLRLLRPRRHTTGESGVWEEELG